MIFANRKHAGAHKRIQSFERGVNPVKSPSGQVSVEYLLINLRVGDEFFSVNAQLINQRLRAVFVGMRTADHVHWHVGVYENHGITRRPLPLCSSMSSMSSSRHWQSSGVGQ